MGDVGMETGVEESSTPDSMGKRARDIKSQMETGG